MRAKIYEYIKNGSQRCFSDVFITDGMGCWELDVEIPESLKPYISSTGFLCIEPYNGGYQEAIFAGHDSPWIIYDDENGDKNKKKLKVYSRKEKENIMTL